MLIIRAIRFLVCYRYTMDNMDPIEIDLYHENRLLKEEKEAYLQREKLFHALVETAVGEIGESFFEKIVIRLSEWLNAECVIIGLMTSANTVEGFPMYLDGKIVRGFTYNLEGTPCDITSRKGYCVYPVNVRSSFPKSKDLREMNIQGYVGSALYNKEGKANGILSAMSRQELNLPNQAEKIIRIIGTRISNEIERIKASKALEVSEKNLREANASKDRLFSIIAHDLKSPFNSLIGFSKMLIDHVKHNKFQQIADYALIINDVATQTHVLLSNLLEWAMVQTNSIAFHPKMHILADICDEIVALYRNQSAEKKISLVTDVSPDIKVYADLNMIHIVLRNLVSNAVKYTNAGGKITVSAVAAPSFITVSVADSGIGMPPEHVDKLFKIESGFSTNGTKNEKGTGIGLILCHDLVRKHKGDIMIDSKQGVGTRFSFTLPNPST